MTTTSDFGKRLRQLEDRTEIGELIARYCLVMDNRDMEGMSLLFTPDAVVRSADGVMHARGLAAIVDMFHGRFKVLGPSNHFTHDRIVTFDAADPDLARGTVLAHAEMHRLGQPMLTAIRYEDVYRRHDDSWRFADRLLTFFYYVPTADYLEALGPGIGARMRAYGDRRPADWPESLASWQRYYGA